MKKIDIAKEAWQPPQHGVDSRKTIFFQNATLGECSCRRHASLVNDNSILFAETPSQWRLKSGEKARNGNGAGTFFQGYSRKKRLSIQTGGAKPPPS
ncbi:MAG: hypothetical protein RRY20_02865 [Bilophila sp.]